MGTSLTTVIPDILPYRVSGSQRIAASREMGFRFLAPDPNKVPVGQKSFAIPFIEVRRVAQQNPSDPPFQMITSHDEAPGLHLYG